MTVAENALAAVRARFLGPELARVARQPYPDVLREARERRAAALMSSRLEETEESWRETPLIRALHAFYIDREPEGALVPWDGSLVR